MCDHVRSCDQSYLLLDVLEGGGGDDGEADKEHVGLGVREWAEPVVVLLTCSERERAFLYFYSGTSL